MMIHKKVRLCLLGFFYISIIVASEKPNTLKQKIAHWYSVCKKKLLHRALPNQPEVEYNGEPYYIYCSDDEEQEAYGEHAIIEYNCDYYIGGEIDQNGTLIHGIQKDALVRYKTSSVYEVPKHWPIQVINKTGSITISQSEDHRVWVTKKLLAQKGFEETIEESSQARDSSSNRTKIHKPMFICKSNNNEPFHRAFLDYFIKVPAGVYLLLSTHFKFPIRVTDVELCNLEAHSFEGSINVTLAAPFIKIASHKGYITFDKNSSKAEQLVELQKKNRNIFLSYWKPSPQFDALPLELRKQIVEYAVQDPIWEYDFRSKGKIAVTMPRASSGNIYVYPKERFETNFETMSKLAENVQISKRGFDGIFGSDHTTLNKLIMVNDTKTSSKIRLRKKL